MKSIQFLLNSIQFLFFKIKVTLEDLKIYYYYTKDYESLITKFLEYIENLKKRFLEQKKLFYSLENNKYFIKFKDQSDYIYSIILDLKYFHLIIKYLKLAKDFSIHQSIFIILKNYIRRISTSSIFILIPDFRFNYSYYNVTKNLQNISIDLEIDDIIYFSIPYLNQTDVFSSALLGHELGHYIIWKKRLVEEKISKLNDFNDFESKEIIKNEKTKEFKKRIDIWGEEFVSDLIGLRIFGLPFFFAFLEFSFLERPYQSSSEKYPPYWLRLKFLINGIETMKIPYIIEKQTNDLKINGIDYSQEIRDIIEYIKENIESLKKESLKDEDYKEIIESVEEDDIYKEVNQEVNDILNDYKELIYNYDKDKILEIGELIKLLDEYIVPNGIISKDNNSDKPKFIPADIINILNAGWFYLLINIKRHYKIFNIDKEEDFSKKEGRKMEIRNKLNLLILKAIELSNIKKEYKKRKEEYEKKQQRKKKGI